MPDWHVVRHCARSSAAVLSDLGCRPQYHTSTQWCGLRANLGCRFETCCTRLAANTGRKKSSKIRLLGTIAQICRAISSQLRHLSTVGRKRILAYFEGHRTLLFTPIYWNIWGQGRGWGGGQLALHQRRTAPAQSPIFGPCLLWPNGWMDQYVTW